MTAVAYTVMLSGILLRLVPIEGHTAAGGIAAEPSEAFSFLHLILAGAGTVLALGIIVVYARRVKQSPAAALDFDHAIGIEVRTIDESERQPALTP